MRADVTLILIVFVENKLKIEKINSENINKNLQSLIERKMLARYENQQTDKLWDNFEKKYSKIKNNDQKSKKVKKTKLK